MIKGFICLLLFIPCIAISQSTEELMKVTDMLKIKSISNVSLDKDGTKALFTVTAIELDGDSKLEYKYVNQVWMVYTDGHEPAKQLTSRENASQASFSPAGDQVAFVRTIDNKPQVFLLPLNGGEARQLTFYKYGASNPAWSPDGKKILFSSSVPMKDLIKDSLLNGLKTLPGWPMEKPGFETNYAIKPGTKADPDGNMEEIRTYLETNAGDKKAKVLNRLNFLDEMDVNSDFTFNHWSIIDLSPGSKPVMITKGYYRFSSAEFSPDGSKVLLSADLDSLQHPDRSLEAEIFMAYSDGKGLRKIIGEEKKAYVNPKLSPLGKWISFNYGETLSLTFPQLGVMPVNGTEKDIITIPFDRTKSNLTWSEDEKYIYFTSASNGGQPVYRSEISSGKTERLTDFNSGIQQFDLAKNIMVYVKTEVAAPFELYASDASGKNERKLTNLNEWVKNKKLSIPEKHSFKNEKGLEVEYWIMKPTNYEEGKKYPLLVEIHGGPASMWGPGEASMWHEYQYFCSRGYGIMYSNPRGSQGYGNDFLKANKNDWGKGPASDVITALNKTIASEKWADTSRLLITGGSYAGYLVAWIISHDNRFKAACSQRGVYDLATFFGEGNAWRLVPLYFGGYPWEPAVKQILERESPINYVQNITTPYIIFHGDNDRRTGFVQSEMMYKSLKVLGRPVEYVRHPSGTHELTRSGNNRQRIDQMLRTYEFFQRWIK